MWAHSLVRNGSVVIFPPELGTQRPSLVLLDRDLMFGGGFFFLDQFVNEPWHTATAETAGWLDTLFRPRGNA